MIANFAAEKSLNKVKSKSSSLSGSKTIESATEPKKKTFANVIYLLILLNVC